MQTQLKFQCPHCDQRLQSMQELAGRSFDCPQCTTSIVVPTTHALVPVNQPLVIAEAIDDYEEYEVAHHGHYQQNDSKPVKMRLGNLAEMDVEVDQPTRNAMATTFLGGLLVALGAILFAMFGGKGKSA